MAYRGVLSLMNGQDLMRLSCNFKKINFCTVM